MSKKSLFEIENKYLQLLLDIEENEGVLDGFEEALEILNHDFAEKMQNYRYIILAKQANIEMLKDEKNRMSDRIKVNENIIKRLKEVQIKALRLFGSNTKTGGFNYDFGDFKASTYQLDVVQENEVEVAKLVNDVLDSIKFSLEGDEIDFSIFKFTTTISISNKQEFETYCKIREIIEANNLDFNIDVKVDKKAVASFLKSDITEVEFDKDRTLISDAYKLGKTDVIKYT